MFCFITKAPRLNRTPWAQNGSCFSTTFSFQQATTDLQSKCHTSEKTEQCGEAKNKPPFKWATRFFPRAKQPVCEGDHSVTLNAKVKNEWSYTSNPLTYLHGLGRDNFTFVTLQALKHASINKPVNKFPPQTIPCAAAETPVTLWP